MLFATQTLMECTKTFIEIILRIEIGSIRAFNENLGYDDFVRYQIAGDLSKNLPKISRSHPGSIACT